MTTFLENYFRLKEHKTDVRTEVLAGITTFMTMAYILAVNPGILSAAGMDAGAVFTATALGACIGTVLMALFSNYPFALAPGMGLNAFFAYTVVGQMGYSWQVALAAVFVEGIIFIILSLTKVRSALFNAIPPALKFGVTSGIGLFITFIGLQNAKIVVSGPTLVGLYPFKAAFADGTFWSTGIGALLALIGILLTAVMLAKKVPGGILLGIIITWGLGMLCELTGIYVPDPKLGMFSVMPSFANGIAIPSLAPTFMQLDFSAIFTFNFVTIMLSFMFVDLFDTLGTLIGVASKANMLDKNGRLPKIEGALLADAIATTGGALLGTSTVTTFVESSAGVAAGGRTGLTSITVAVLFFLSLFFAPIFLAIPAFATAPALVIVGFLMVSSLLNVDFNDMTEAIPAFIAAVAMPFMYSISEGIAMGVISYVVINLLSGAHRMKQISGVIYILAIIFVLKYIYV
ncbi:NCS2 family permease [uncultured Phascolarctobacterium sp.]|uniref:NCS2 family permease n=1 Tax=uncultured Phascolarctobacterium sp. TaxID=512296 RepID=UPI0025E93161|nr:NCS2 family permease [uncultured Phascolarctobacterium sp.]